MHTANPRTASRARHSRFRTAFRISEVRFYNRFHNQGRAHRGRSQAAPDTSDEGYGPTGSCVTGPRREGDGIHHAKGASILLFATRLSPGQDNPAKNKI